MIRYIFRPTTADFRKWCREYVSLSFDVAATYKNEPLLIGKEDYEYACKICRRYRVLMASLDKKERAVLERIISGKAISYSVKEEQVAFLNIFSNWQEICFPEREYAIKTITKEQIGDRIKAMRERRGYTRQYVSDVIGISVSTLKSYENGDRMIRLDVAYQLAQLFGESLDNIAYYLGEKQ